MANLGVALTITLIGMGVIFVVLILLWIAIVSLDKIFPYKAPVMAASSTTDDKELVAVIQAAIAVYLNRRPDSVTIKSIK